MRSSARRLPKRRTVKLRSFKPRFEALEGRDLLSGTPLPFDDSALAPAGLQAICALPNLPVFNVHSYGATGNGVTDDTVAIRAALSAAETAGGGIIYLPTGTYAVDPQASDPVAWGSIFTITSSNIVFIGDGAGNTHLKGYVEGLKDPVTNWYVTGDSYIKIGRFSMFSVDSSASGADISNVQFRSLDINGDAGYTGDSLVGGSVATGDGWDMTHKGIMLNGSHRIDNTLVFNCDVRNWRGEEVYAGGGTNLGAIDIVNCHIYGSNASAVSATGSVLMSNSTVGGNNPGDDVYNGIEDYCVLGQSNLIEDSTIMCSSDPANLHGNGIGLIGDPAATSLTVQRCTITQNHFGILFSEAATNVLIDGNTFSNNGQAMITSILGLYSNLTTGFANFTISDNTFNSSGAAFLAQNTVTGFILNGNTVTNGCLLNGGGFAGSVGSWGTFLVENNTLGTGATDVNGYGGSNVALWTNTVRPAVGTTAFFTSSGDTVDDFSTNTTTVVTFLTDLTILNSNTNAGSQYVVLGSSMIGKYPVGFQTTIYDWSKTNWVLKADPTWNTFSSDLPIGPDGLTIRVNSQGLFEVLNPATSTATSTVVTSSASASDFGQSITFTATVTADTPGASTPTGSVTFRDGNITLGTAALNSTGAATFSISTLSVGSHAIVVYYGGDPNCATSIGQTTQTVIQASSSASVTSSGSTSVSGQSVTFTVTVSPATPGAGVPTGSVTFFDGSIALAIGTLDSTGKATFSTRALAVGSHAISAYYGGDVNFVTSVGNMSQTVNPASASASVTSSGSTSVFGQSVTFTVAVSPATPGAGVPTGGVTFMDGSTILATGILDLTGKATFSTTTLAVGSHAISASYGGDVNFAATVGNTTQTVNPAATSTAAISSASPSVLGQLVTFTATVSDSLSAMPTGNVTFFDGTAMIGTGALDSTGKASLKTSALSAGSHTIKVSYSGCASFSASSAQFAQMVSQPTKITSTTLASSVRPSVFGQSVTFTTTVSATAPGSGTPTGTVTFLDGTTTLGTATLNASGTATFNSAALAVGNHTISVSYGGVTNFAASTSGNLIQTVVHASTSTTVSSSATSPVFGQSVTFTATVGAAAPGSGTPTGTVTFLDGATTLGTATLNASGTATFSSAALAVGSHAITVSYGGDPNFATSTGNTTQTVNQAATTTTAASSASSSVVGQLVTYTAIVSAVAPSSGTPPGTVAFLDGTTTLATVTVDSTGKATFTTAALAVGSHTITAYRAGGPRYAASSANVTQTVSQASTSTSTTLTSSASSSVFCQSVTFTATVSAKALGSGTPKGTVTFADGSTILGTGTLDSTGKATFNTSALGVGSHAISVSYGGATNFTISTGQLTQTVNQATTKTTLTSSASSSLFAQSVTFTAIVSAVAPSSGTPPGTVAFLDGTITLATVTVDSTGKATFTTAALTVGSHTFTAYRAGGPRYAASSANVTQTVSQASTSTSTTLTSSASSSVFGQSVTFTATVSAKALGSGTPKGTVTFADGSTILGTGTLDSTGKATFNTSALGVGSHAISVSYGGATNFTISTGQLTQTVDQAKTKTTLTSSASSSLFGQSVTFTAIVSAVAPSSGTPPGTVAFLDGTITLATVTVDSTGKATFTTAALSVGSHTITAYRAGGPRYAASSANVTQTVSQASTSTSTTLTSSASSSVFGQSVTFTATVSANALGSSAPPKTVVFLDGTNILGTGMVDSSGRATFSTAALDIGSHTITMSYVWGANLASSTATMTQTVNQAITSTTLTSSANSSVLGQSVTFTASVVALAPGSRIPVGKVTFLDGSTVLATVLLDSTGLAAFTTSALEIGDHVITASYDGVPNFAVSSGFITQMVS